jgi:hypothetical protein
MIRKTAATVASALLLTVAACGGSGSSDKRPDVHACKAAMIQKFHDALTTDAPTPTSSGPPAACAGVSQEDLLKIVAEIFNTESPGPE